MGNYSFSDEAIHDLEEICEYIGRSNPKAASKLFDKIRSKCKLVAGFPNMGKSYGQLRKNLCGFVLDDYIIFYYPQEDGINIKGTPKNKLSNFTKSKRFFLPLFPCINSVP